MYKSKINTEQKPASQKSLCSTIGKKLCQICSRRDYKDKNECSWSTTEQKGNNVYSHEKRKKDDKESNKHQVKHILKKLLRTTPCLSKAVQSPCAYGKGKNNCETCCLDKETYRSMLQSVKVIELIVDDVISKVQKEMLDDAEKSNPNFSTEKKERTKVSLRFEVFCQKDIEHNLKCVVVKLQTVIGDVLLQMCFCKLKNTSEGDKCKKYDVSVRVLEQLKFEYITMKNYVIQLLGRPVNQKRMHDVCVACIKEEMTECTEMLQNMLKTGHKLKLSMRNDFVGNGKCCSRTYPHVHAIVQDKHVVLKFQIPSEDPLKSSKCDLNKPATKSKEDDIVNPCPYDEWPEYFQPKETEEFSEPLEEKSSIQEEEPKKISCLDKYLDGNLRNTKRFSTISVKSLENVNLDPKTLEEEQSSASKLSNGIANDSLKEDEAPKMLPNISSEDSVSKSSQIGSNSSKNKDSQPGFKTSRSRSSEKHNSVSKHSRSLSNASEKDDSQPNPEVPKSRSSDKYDTKLTQSGVLDDLSKENSLSSTKLSKTKSKSSVLSSTSTIKSSESKTKSNDLSKSEMFCGCNFDEVGKKLMKDQTKYDETNLQQSKPSSVEQNKDKDDSSQKPTNLSDTIQKENEMIHSKNPKVEKTDSENTVETLVSTSVEEIKDKDDSSQKPTNLSDIKQKENEMIHSKNPKVEKTDSENTVETLVSTSVEENKDKDDSSQKPTNLSDIKQKENEMIHSKNPKVEKTDSENTVETLVSTSVEENKDKDDSSQKPTNLSDIKQKENEMIHSKNPKVEKTDSENTVETLVSTSVEENKDKDDSSQKPTNLSDIKQKENEMIHSKNPKVEKTDSENSVETLISIVDSGSNDSFTRVKRQKQVSFNPDGSKSQIFYMGGTTHSIFQTEEIQPQSIFRKPHNHEPLPSIPTVSSSLKIDGSRKSAISAVDSVVLVKNKYSLLEKSKIPKELKQSTSVEKSSLQATQNEFEIKKTLPTKPIVPTLDKKSSTKLNKQQISEILFDLGAENLLSVSLPAECCKNNKSINNFKFISDLPYSASLDSLPLDQNDVDKIKKTVENLKSSEDNVLHSDCDCTNEWKMKYRNELEKEDISEWHSAFTAKDISSNICIDLQTNKPVTIKRITKNISSKEIPNLPTITEEEEVKSRGSSQSINKYGNRKDGNKSGTTKSTKSTELRYVTVEYPNVLNGMKISGDVSKKGKSRSCNESKGIYAERLSELDYQTCSYQNIEEVDKELINCTFPNLSRYSTKTHFNDFKKAGNLLPENYLKGFNENCGMRPIDEMLMLDVIYLSSNQNFQSSLNASSVSNSSPLCIKKLPNQISSKSMNFKKKKFKTPSNLNANWRAGVLGEETTKEFILNNAKRLPSNNHYCGSDISTSKCVYTHKNSQMLNENTENKNLKNDNDIASNNNSETTYFEKGGIQNCNTENDLQNLLINEKLSTNIFDWEDTYNNKTQKPFVLTNLLNPNNIKNTLVIRLNPKHHVLNLRSYAIRRKSEIEIVEYNNSSRNQIYRRFKGKISNLPRSKKYKTGIQFQVEKAVLNSEMFSEN
ncbi:uncharacterized protein LOC128999384 [Macrosteles quadrilineatus]|uniref:uncharacterized protein LOC128999384 n=1 Tax=Macrosteles quadrilineatus TaxID=74068 RepID=UPI0023E0E421|nr:uncharacterized protein LOC128999384 [Macrosteles quadrilineatus]